MDLRGKLPHETYNFLITTDGTHLYDGSGSLITNLTITNITSSNITASYISQSFISSSGITSSFVNTTRLSASNAYISGNLTVGGTINGTSMVQTASFSFQTNTASFVTSPIALDRFSIQPLGDSLQFNYLPDNVETGQYVFNLGNGSNFQLFNRHLYIDELDVLSSDGVTSNFYGQADTAISASCSLVSATASFVTASNVIGQVLSSVLSDTASFFNGTVIGSPVSASHSIQSDSASYATGAFVQGGNSFGTSASLGTNDPQMTVIRANGLEVFWVSSSLSQSISASATQSFSSSFVGIGVNPQTAGFPLTIGGVGQLQLSGSSPRIVAAHNSSSLTVSGGGPGVLAGSRWELYGEGGDTSNLAGGQLQAGVYFATKRSGSFIIQNLPTVAVATNPQNLMVINPSGSSFNGKGSCGLFCGSAGPTASLDVFGDIRAMTSITSSIMSASLSITASGMLAVSDITAGNITSSFLGNGYAISSSIFTAQNSSYTLSQADDGKLVVVNSGSVVTITVTTSSISPTYSCMFYQSGSGTIMFTTASISVILRNRSGFSGSAGRYALASLLRVPNGDFVLGGDLA